MITKITPEERTFNSNEWEVALPRKQLGPKTICRIRNDHQMMMCIPNFWTRRLPIQVASERTVSLPPDTSQIQWRWVRWTPIDAGPAIVGAFCGDLGYEPTSIEAAERFLKVITTASNRLQRLPMTALRQVSAQWSCRSGAEPRAEASKREAALFSQNLLANIC